jgi:hypothetical protein
MLRGSGTMWLLLYNLRLEVNYQMKQDEKLLFVKMASKQGTLVFDSSLNNKSSHFEFIAEK